MNEQLKVSSLISKTSTLTGEATEVLSKKKVWSTENLPDRKGLGVHNSSISLNKNNLLLVIFRVTLPSFTNLRCASTKQGIGRATVPNLVSNRCWSWIQAALDSASLMALLISRAISSIFRDAALNWGKSSCSAGVKDINSYENKKITDGIVNLQFPEYL